MPMAARKYSNIFRKLSKDQEVAFDEYLTDQQLDVLGLLIKMGLNESIITPSNYEEIKSLVEKVISTDYYPVVQHHGKSEFTICDIDTDKDSTISISRNLFCFCENETYEDGFDEISRHQVIKFILEPNGNVTRLAFDSREKNYDYRSADSFETDGSRITTNYDGEVLEEHKFNLKINQRLKSDDYSKLFGCMYYKDITDYLETVSTMMQTRRVKMRCLELDMHLGDEEVKINNGFTTRRILDKKEQN